MKFINAGYSNLIAAERIVLIAAPDSAPVKRLMQDAKDAGRAIDLTCGKRTRSVILTDTEHVILSALPPERLETRAGEDECSQAKSQESSPEGSQDGSPNGSHAGTTDNE